MKILHRRSNISLLIISLVFLYGWICFGGGNPTTVSQAWADGKATAVTKPTPRAVFPETTYNFGSVMEGNQVKHDFIIENKGDAPLAIHRVKPD